jgi:hypothetical protein
LEEKKENSWELLKKAPIFGLIDCSERFPFQLNAIVFVIMVRGVENP